MQRKQTTYWKSLLLLLAFGLHTITGFACSVSPWLHQLHHAAQAAASDDHTPPCHQKKEHSKKEAPQKDCCAASVALAQKAEKSLTRSIDAPEVALVASFLVSFFQWQPVASLSDTGPLLYARWRHPGAPPNLCIALHTFRI